MIPVPAGPDPSAFAFLVNLTALAVIGLLFSSKTTRCSALIQGVPPFIGLVFLLLSALAS